MRMEPKWLEWARELQAIGQSGLAYTENEYDRERYHKIGKIAAEIIAEYSDEDFDLIYSLFAREEGYATPKVGVRGAVFHDDSILLVREREEGLWALPGGWADVNESPSEAVCREVFEESAYSTRAVKLLAVHDTNKHGHEATLYHGYRLIFLCEIVGEGTPESIETDRAAFFHEDEIPELSPSRSTHAEISRLFEHYRHPELPTDFD